MNKTSPAILERPEVKKRIRDAVAVLDHVSQLSCDNRIDMQYKRDDGTEMFIMVADSSERPKAYKEGELDE